MTGGGAKANAILMLRPDGTPMTKKEVIKKRRGAFKWLPVLCSNDLVHGSWWMVWGSFGCAAFAVLPLVQQYETFYKTHDDLLPPVDFTLTWSLLIFSGVFFTFGSLAFVRAFGEPPRQALFYWYKHLQTDELLGAWLFLFGTAPAVPYSLVYFLLDPTFSFLGALTSSGVFVLGSIVFVMASYPSASSSDKARKNIIMPWALRMFGPRIWVVKHLANDWLAGTWFFFWANLLFTIFSFILLFHAFTTGDPEQIFLWLSSAVNSFLFLIGSAYFVSGSYPHAQQFYYAIDRGQKDGPLEYDAPENLPDYADDAEGEHIASFTLSGGRTMGAGNHRPTAGVGAGAGAAAVVSPLHTSAGTVVLDTSGAIGVSKDGGHGAAHGSATSSGKSPMSKSSKGSKTDLLEMSETPVEKEKEKTKLELLSTDEDENFEDDEDDVEAAHRAASATAAATSAMSSSIFAPTAVGAGAGAGAGAAGTQTKFFGPGSNKSGPGANSGKFQDVL